jgi:hypothetical protein
MGKVLSTVGKIVTIAAIAIGTVATGGLLLAGAPLTTALGVGFGGAIGGLGVSSVGIGVVGTLISTVGGAISNPDFSLEDTGANSRGNTFLDPNAVGAFVFGDTAVPMALVFEENHGADNEFVSSVFANAWHTISAWGDFYVDGELVTFSGSSAVGSYAGILTRQQRDGGPAASPITLSGTLWPASATGAGMAYTALVWNFKDQDKLTAGVPSRIVSTAKGALLYDPRLDSTAGGSGAQRYSDPTSWTFNDGNAALVALRYIIGERSITGDLIWGVGEDQTDIDIASFISAANVADELRDGVPRYRLGGFFPTTNDHHAFFSQWEANTGGKIARIGGKRFAWLPNNDLTPGFAITEKNLIASVGVQLKAGPDVGSIVNTARGRYISASALFQGALYPEVEIGSFVAEDGGRRILSLDFSWVQDVETAERLALQAIYRSRFGRIWKVAMGWEGLTAPPFTVGTLNIAETNNVDQLVRVIDSEFSTSGLVILTLQEEDASIYDDATVLGTPPPILTQPKTLGQSATVLSRYNDGTDINKIVSDPMNKVLDPNIRAGQGASAGRVLNIGGAEGVAFDGDAVNFTTPWDQPPLVKYGPGGVSFDPLISGSQQPVFTVLNLTTSGFIASLKIKSASGGGTVNFSDGPGVLVGGSPAWQIEKVSATQSSSDSYSFFYSVNSDGCEIVPGEPIVGFTRVGFYTRTISGGAWTKRGETNHSSTGSFQAQIVVDGLGANAAFGVHEEATSQCAVNGITAFTKVDYSNTPTTVASATPSGVDPVPFFLIGNKDSV